MFTNTHTRIHVVTFVSAEIVGKVVVVQRLINTREQRLAVGINELEMCDSASNRMGNWMEPVASSYEFPFFGELNDEAVDWHGIVYIHVSSYDMRR